MIRASLASPLALLLTLLAGGAPALRAQEGAELRAMITRDAGKKVTLPDLELTLPEGWVRPAEEVEKMIGRIMLARAQDLLDGEDAPLMLHLAQKRDPDRNALLLRWQAEGGVALTGTAAQLAGAVCAWKNGDEEETELHYGVPVGQEIQELILVVPGACNEPPPRIHELIATLHVTASAEAMAAPEPTAPAAAEVQVDPPQDGPWGAAVSRAKETMRVVLSPMSPEAEERFAAQWMPLFDHPCEAVRDWLGRLQPLLDAFAQAHGELQDLLAAFEDELLEAEMAAAYGSEAGLCLAQRRIDRTSTNLRQRRDDLESLRERILELGEMPDAQEAKVNAQRRFADEVAALLDTLPPSTSQLDGEWIGSSHYRKQYEPGGEVHTEADMEADGRWFGRRFHRFFRKIRELGGGLSLFYEYRYADDDFDGPIPRETVDCIVLREHGESFLLGYSTVRNPHQLRYSIDEGTLRLEHRNISDEANRQRSGWAPLTTWVSAGRGSSGPDDLPLQRELQGLVDMTTGGVPALVVGCGRNWHDAVGPDEIRRQRLGGVNWRRCVRAEIARAKATQLQEPPRFGASEDAERQALEAARRAELERRQEKVDFHRQNIALLEQDVARYEKQLGEAKDLASRERIQRWILAKKADLQGEHDSIQTVMSGNFTRTRTAWDAMNESSMRERTLRMATEHRLARQRREGIERMIEAMPEAERWELRRFVDRQLSERSLDLDRIGQVGKAIGKRLQGHYGAVSAKNEEEAAFHDEVIKTQERYDKYVVTPTMMVGGIFVPGGGTVASYYGMASGAVSGYQKGSAGAKLYNDIRRDWGYTDKKGEIDDRGITGALVNIGTGIVTSYTKALGYTLTFAGGYYQVDPKTGQRRGVTGGAIDTALAWSYDKCSENYQKYRQQTKLTAWRDAKRRADFDQEMQYGKAMASDLHRAHVAHQKRPSPTTRKALLAQAERVQNNPHARAAVHYNGSPQELRSYRQAAEMRAQQRVELLRGALASKGVDVQNVEIRVLARQPRVTPGSDLGIVIRTKDRSGLVRRQNSSADGHHIVALKDLRRLAAKSAAELGRQELPPVNETRVASTCSVRIEGGVVQPVPVKSPSTVNTGKLPPAKSGADLRARFRKAGQDIEELVLPRLDARRARAEGEAARESLQQTRKFWSALRAACGDEQVEGLSRELRLRSGLHPVDALHRLELGMAALQSAKGR